MAMRNEDASVFAVPIRESWLLYAPLRGLSALLNERAFRELVSHLKENRTVSAVLVDLVNVFGDQVEDRCPPARDAFSPEFLGIIPTRACNLSCVYCGFGSHSAGEEGMRQETAVQAVDWMAETVRRDGRKNLEIHFFGGEPLCAPDIVDVALHRARSKASEWGLTTHFEISTNGCFDEKRCAFVGDYFDAVILSWDGFPEFQDRYRPRKSGKGSYDQVARNARKLAESSTELCIRICATSENLSCLDRIVRSMCEDISPSIIDIETLKPTLGAVDFGLSPPDPFEFAIAFSRCEAIAGTMGVRTVFAASEIDKVRRSFCPVGTDTVIVAPNGVLSACYLEEDDWTMKGLNLSYGRIETGGNFAIDPLAADRIRAICEKDGRCAACFVRWHCAGGCHVENAGFSGDDAYPDSCVQTRIIAAARMLRALGLHDEASSFLGDELAMERMARRSSDTLAAGGL